MSFCEWYDIYIWKTKEKLVKLREEILAKGWIQDKYTNPIDCKKQM